MKSISIIVLSLFIAGCSQTINETEQARKSIQESYPDLSIESIKKVEDDRYDQIFVDLNDDQYCIDLSAKNMNSLIKNKNKRKYY